MTGLTAFVLALQAATGPTCRTADVRLEQIVSAKAAELRGEELCQSRLYHTIDDVDGDGRDDFIVVFTIEGGAGGNDSVQFLTLFASRGGWNPLTAQVGKRGERFVEGIEVDARSTIVLRTIEYEKGDPACCPSGRGDLRFTLLRGRLLESGATRPKP